MRQNKGTDILDNNNNNKINKIKLQVGLQVRAVAALTYKIFYLKNCVATVLCSFKKSSEEKLSPPG